MHFTKVLMATLAMSASTITAAPTGTQATDLDLTNQAAHQQHGGANNTVGTRESKSQFQGSCDNSYKFFWTHYTIRSPVQLSDSQGESIKKQCNKCGLVTKYKKKDENGETKIEFNTIIGVMGCINDAVAQATDPALIVDCFDGHPN